MIDLGDIIKVKRGNEPVMVATEVGIEDVRLAKFGTAVFNDYWECQKLRKQEIYQRIRNGVYQKCGNAESTQEASIRHQDLDAPSYSFDAEGTESVYQDAENGDYPQELEPDVLLYNTVVGSIPQVTEAGWKSDILNDDLLQFKNGAVESYTAVTQAMKEGIWILMTSVGSSR